MKYFLLLIPFFILSCGTETSVDEPETETAVTIGTWDVYFEQDKAEWVGNKSKYRVAGRDTVIIESPDGQGIQIQRYGYYPGATPEEQEILYQRSDFAFVFQYVDSTITPAEYGEQDMAYAEWEVHTPFDDEKENYVSSWGISDWGIMAQGMIPFDCDSTYALNDEMIVFNYSIPNQDVNKSFQFVAEGMYDSIEGVMCD